MINRDKIISAMETKMMEIYNASETYKSRGEHGILAVQIKSDTRPGQWDCTIVPFGTPYVAGFSMDTTVHEKMAYVRRTGKKSGAEQREVVGTESYWEGAIISEDGNCICAFSGFEGSDDVLIAEAGMEVYEASK